MIIENRLKGVNSDSPSFIVECDQCGNPSRKQGKDHGEAADKARAEGFITIPGASKASPRSWLCLKCSKA